MYCLKFKNLLIKAVLTFLGFTLAASQCLAQYMAIVPKVKIYGKLKGVTDTISKFKIVINNCDTLYSSWAQKYSFIYNGELSTGTYKIEVTEDTDKRNQKYSPHTEIVAINPRDELKKEVTVTLTSK